MMKIRKITFIRATAFVIVVLVFQYLFLKGSVRTLTHGYFPKQHNLTTISNNYKPLQYTIYDYTVNIKVPDATEVHVSPYQGDEMRFSIYFVNSELAFRGYIQVWKIKDLEHFLSDSKSLSPFDFKSYNISDVQKNNYHGLKTEWTADFGQNFISGKEYWFIINNSEEVVRVSFFTDTAEFPGELQNVIQQILNSFQIDKIN
ncbi:MAG: hypothetical protein ACYCVD_03695 [Desulfitobacteriaceae bacterium]